MKKVNSVFNDLILNRLVHELKIRMDATVDNKWQVLHPIDYSFGMACSGFDIKQPIFEFFENGFWHLKIKLNKNLPLNIDNYCTDAWLS